MNIQGKIKVVNATQQVSASFKKRELVVSTNEQYVQHILIEFNQDKCSILDQYKVGDDVSIDVNLRGREYINPQGEAKYFNQIQGWRISKVTDAAPESAVENYNSQEPEEGDPLPF